MQINKLPYGTYVLKEDKLILKKKKPIMYKGIKVKPENPMYGVMEYYDKNKEN